MQIYNSIFFLCNTYLLLIGHCSGKFTTSASITPDGRVHLDNSNDENGDNNIASNDDEYYGVDVSWPMHYHLNEEDDDGKQRQRILSDQKELYESYMDGCADHWSREACELNEKDRITMNLNQPKSMQNYTNAGYAKVKAPKNAYKLLRNFWNTNHGKEQKESWPPGNIYTNHWNVPTKLLRLGDEELRGCNNIHERRNIITQVQQVLESWSRQALVPTSMYGIRIYSEASILSPHVDRLPLVVSAIINVAQDVDEPWPLEVVGHDGIATNVTMEPGEMILYESHSVIHGRPYPLRGRYYSNVFIHFEPVGHSQRHSPQSESYGLTSGNDQYKELYNRAMKRSKKKKKMIPKVPTIPHYINKEGGGGSASDKESMWRQDYVFVRETASSTEDKQENKRSNSARAAHLAAAEGDLNRLKRIVAENPVLIDKHDHNGWQPLHEAARAGRTNVVEYLIDKGIDINKRTNQGKGATALWWAEHMLRDDHPTVKLLKKHGGVNIGPDE